MFAFFFLDLEEKVWEKEEDVSGLPAKDVIVLE